MIRAVKGSDNEKKSEQARQEYCKLKEIFNVEPKLIEYLNREGKCAFGSSELVQNVS